MRHIFRPTTLWLCALAFSGVVAGHMGSYIASEPEPHHRELLLEETGHGSWWVIGAALALAFLIGSIGAFVAHRLHRGGSPGARPQLVAHLSARLAPLQVAGFVILEATERTYAGSLSQLLHERVFWVGIIVQILVAVLASLLFAVIGLAVEAILERLRTDIGEKLSTILLPTGALAIPAPALLPSARTTRGPPLR